MATNNILVSLFLPAISALIHLNTRFKLIIARKTNLSKRKTAVLATIMERSEENRHLLKGQYLADEKGEEKFSNAKGAVHGACRRTSTIHFAKSELTKVM